MRLIGYQTTLNLLISLIQHVLSIISLATISFTATSAVEGSSLSLNQTQIAAVEKAFPGALVLSEQDIDEKSCKPIPGSPGHVIADFNGDGQMDFAALLMIGKEGEPIQWQGQVLRKRNYAFAIFLADKKVGFRVKFSRRFESYAPLSAYLEPQNPGPVIDRDTNRNVVIQHAAVVFVFCEKSASIYYISHNHVLEIFLAD